MRVDRLSQEKTLLEMSNFSIQADMRHMADQVKRSLYHIEL